MLLLPLIWNYGKFVHPLPFLARNGTCGPSEINDGRKGHHLSSKMMISVLLFSDHKPKRQVFKFLSFSFISLFFQLSRSQNLERDKRWHGSAQVHLPVQICVQMYLRLFISVISKQGAEILRSSTCRLNFVGCRLQTVVACFCFWALKYIHLCTFMREI